MVLPRNHEHREPTSPLGEQGPRGPRVHARSAPIFGSAPKLQPTYAGWHTPTRTEPPTALEGVVLSLRTRTLLLFLAFLLVPLGAVGVVATLGTRVAVERTIATMPGQSQSEPAPTAVTPGADQAPAQSVDEILAPLNRVLIAYVAFMLAVAAAATLGFRLAMRRLFLSLEEISGAVERIARGDLAPWLPLPGQDEVGWLSLALGRMAERVGQMMQGMEQSGRLAVAGEMAAQMAHEVRTPLSSIKMNLQLLERAARRGGIPDDAQVSIDTSLSEIVRLEASVNRMLEFGSPERGIRSRCSLHTVIGEAVDLLRSACEKQGVTMSLGLTAESDSIWADRGRVKGVFLNLLVNARDAMPGGGEIMVETQLILGDEGQQMVAVAVSDSGPGVPVSLREEVFHPFFTTKTQGSGIGLPAALRTLREHGGDLYLSERPDGGSGACFVALFPLALSEVGKTPSRSNVDPKWPALERKWRRTPKDSRQFTEFSRVPPPDEGRDEGPEVVRRAC